MREVRRSIATPLGHLSITGVAPAVGVAVSGLQPKLPRGMSVAACHGALLRLSQLEAGSPCTVEVRLEAAGPVSGGAETGEGLEAMVWRSASHVLAAGTEDAECLLARLGRSAPAATFHYGGSGFVIALEPAQACREMSLHVVLAWNEVPERSPSSCWYAVDQPHDLVASQVAT